MVVVATLLMSEVFHDIKKERKPSSWTLDMLSPVTKQNS